MSAALALASGFLLSRLEEFAWPRFFLAFRWALLAYVISAGMIGFAFVRDHTRGAPLVLVIVMLVIFALDVPVVIAFRGALLLTAIRVVLKRGQVAGLNLRRVTD